MLEPSQEVPNGDVYPMRPIEVIVVKGDSVHDRTIERVTTTVELTNLSVDLGLLEERYGNFLRALESEPTEIADHLTVIRTSIATAKSLSDFCKGHVLKQANGLLTELFDA